MLNKLRKLQNKKGFTLVELIVVIAIIAILTAVIVPLVGRYSAQATYSTLQDGAKTVSTSISTCISEVTKNGTVIKISGVYGKKSGTSLTVALFDGDGNEISSPSGAQATLQSAIKTALESAVDDGSCFIAHVAGNTCDAAIYSKNDLTKPTGTAMKTYNPGVTKDTDFPNDDAYLLGSQSVGVAGNWKVAST